MLPLFRAVVKFCSTNRLFTLLVLNKSIISASLKIGEWFQLGHTQTMGVVAPRAPFVTFLEVTTGSILSYSTTDFSYVRRT